MCSSTQLLACHHMVLPINHHPQHCTLQSQTSNPSKVPSNMSLCFAGLHLYLGAVVGASPLWSVCCFWRGSGSLLGRGKALGVIQPGL
jgi:hypothetical protein